MSSIRALTRGASRISHTVSRGSQASGPTSKCNRCTSRSTRTPAPTSRSTESSFSSGSQDQRPSPKVDFHNIFAQPTWSVRSLLPASSSSSEGKDTPQEITPQTLHHLLRLSALAPPSSPEEETSMLATLHTQLHFVRDIRSVDTTGVAPLRAIRDETYAGLAECTVTLETLQEIVGRETRLGHRRRPRRPREEGRQRSDEERLVESATAVRRERGYYLVESGRAKGGE